MKFQKSKSKITEISVKEYLQNYLLKLYEKILLSK